MRTTAELREGFLSYFESKGHKRHPSGSLVPPAWDHSTLLNSAGMQPLMPYFLGREEPPAPLLATSQKIFRTPDIDEVGLDGFHLTFFEMLGNFSFGQYFKEGAIDFAWEFVFDHMKIDPDLFWVTVFAGDPELGLGEDEEAVRLWEQIGMPPERIIRLDRSHNFWSVGGPGPCGPDTELFYDRGEALGCGRPECAPGCTCERYLEFWNLVFMEFELHADGTVTPLPKQNVDTGMGLERAASDPPGSHLGLRDGRLPVDHGLDRHGERCRVRRIGEGDEGASDPGRPRARDDVPGRRRRPPVERRARLRPAPDHPPRRPAGADDRSRRPLAASPRWSQSRWARGTRSSSSTANGSRRSSGPRRSASPRRSSAG